MEKKISVDYLDSEMEKAFNFLNRSIQGQTITVRDDQYDYSWLMDAVKTHRQRGGRFRLVDSGFLEPGQIQWMAEAGADLYTSDSVGRGEHDLVFFNKACQKGHSITALFHHGPLIGEEEEERLSFSQLKNLGSSGIYIHISNREHSRDMSLMNELAYSCSKGGSWLVYYHHGPLLSDCVFLAESGSWIHISDQNLTEEEHIHMAMDVQKTAHSAGAGLVLVVDSMIKISWLWDIIRSGGFIFFKNRHFDYKSPFRAVQEQALLRLPDFKGYYLNTTALP